MCVIKRITQIIITQPNLCNTLCYTPGVFAVRASPAQTAPERNDLRQGILGCSHRLGEAV